MKVTQTLRTGAESGTKKQEVMKKITFIIAIAGLFALASCQKEYAPVSTEIKPATGGIKFSGTYAQYENTKTLLDEDGKSLKWGNQHDSTEFILVTFDFTSLVSKEDSCYHNQLCDSLGRSKDQKTAYLQAVNPWYEEIREIKPGHRFIALYPYCATGGNANFYPSSSAKIITFPAVQQAVKDGLPVNLDGYSNNKIPPRGNSANVMTAYTTMDSTYNVNFQFKNVGALLKISLSGEAANLATLDRIRIKADTSSVSLSGKPKGTVGTDGIYTLSGSFSSRKDTVTLAEPEGGWKEATYYACVLPTESGKKAKLSVSFIYKNEGVVKKTNPTAKAIERNQIYNLGSFTIGAAPKPELPTHKYLFYSYSKGNIYSLGKGLHSLMDDAEQESGSTYFSVGTQENWANSISSSTSTYSNRVIRKLGYVTMPLGTYASNMTTDKKDSLKCNLAYAIMKTDSKDGYVKFTTSTEVTSTAIIYHMRKNTDDTFASIALVGVDGENAVKDSVSFATAWDNYTKTEYVLKKGLNYTLKNSSKNAGVDALSTEIALLSLTIQESN